ncbi:MAG TPA: hypothetical protein VM074_11905 [Solimonas sp.]|nr:hypothetical protein [Solimonas sp.]
MPTFVQILLALNLALLAFVAWQLIRLRSKAVTLATELDALAPELAQKPLAADLAVTGPAQKITIQILNPLELAARESWFAEKLGSLTPALIGRIVHERTLQDLRRQLAEHGVKAEVLLARG